MNKLNLTEATTVVFIYNTIISLFPSLTGKLQLNSLAFNQNVTQFAFIID